MNLFDSLKNGPAESKSNSIFTEQNPTGYFSKSEFKSNLELLGSDNTTHHLIKNIDDMFNIMKVGLSLTRMPNHVIYNGKSGSWLALQVGKVKRNLFIPHFGEMQRLVDDYASGRLKIDKTLEDYYKEACGE